MEVRGVRRFYGTVAALDGVSLRVESGEFFGLLGPSGCGKTTLLRVIAGLESVEAGEVSLDGHRVNEVPAHRRPVNTVFQSYALFPHLTVAENVGFGLRMKAVARGELHRRVGEALALTRIEGLEGRYPRQLSGGQQQRVALARALVNQPRVVLLDEPMAALDRPLRRALQGELRALQRRTGLTFILVTHDQEEALALSDRLAVMRAGRVEQVGTPETLYSRPRSRSVAACLGPCNVLEGRWLSEEPGEEGQGVELGFGVVRVGRGKGVAGTRVVVGIRPEQVKLTAVTDPGLGEVGKGGVRQEPIFLGRLVDWVYGGAEAEVVVEVGGTRLQARWFRREGSEPWRMGQEVSVCLPALGVVPLED